MFWSDRAEEAKPRGEHKSPSVNCRGFHPNTTEVKKLKKAKKNKNRQSSGSNTGKIKQNITVLNMTFYFEKEKSATPSKVACIIQTSFQLSPAHPQLALLHCLYQKPLKPHRSLFFTLCGVCANLCSDVGSKKHLMHNNKLWRAQSGIEVCLQWDPITDTKPKPDGTWGTSALPLPGVTHR